MCTALWWFAISYLSDIEFSEFHARYYELLTAIREAIICWITGGIEIMQITTGNQIPYCEADCRSAIQNIEDILYRPQD